MRKLTDNELDVMVFLNSLRESGACNMFESPKHIRQFFDVTEKQSRELFNLWKSVFNYEGEYTEVETDLAIII